ncbi:hypothetical protein MSA03_18780 [Microbacterium saccharophilum]|nr:hypothetical protein MSA03_18780 [Microbacterium saccharophilum]
MAAHAFGGIDEDGALVGQGGGEQLDAAVEEDGGVDVAEVHDARGPIPGPDPHPLRPDTGEVRQGVRLGVTTGAQKSPGITSCSMSE